MKFSSELLFFLNDRTKFYPFYYRVIHMGRPIRIWANNNVMLIDLLCLRLAYESLP